MAFWFHRSNENNTCSECHPAVSFTCFPLLAKWGQWEVTTQCTTPACSCHLVSPGPLVGRLTTVCASRVKKQNQKTKRTSTLECVGDFFSQTAILMSENHKFIHLPFSLEVEMQGFQNRTGFNVCYMSKSCRTKTLVSCQIQIYIYIYKKKNLSYLVTLLLDYSHSSVFCIFFSINLLNLTNNSKLWLLFD